MRRRLLATVKLILAFLVAIGLPALCPGVIDDVHFAPNPRTVSFRSHLDGDISSDPKVRTSEVLLVVPAAGERTASRKSVIVTLPHKTPYQGDEQLYYLQGYAVGFMCAVNQQFR